MGKQRKLYSRYSKETKLEAVRRVLEEEQPVQFVVEDLNIRHRDNVYEWVKKYKEKGIAAFDRNINLDSTKEKVNKLETRVAVLKSCIELVAPEDEVKYQLIDHLKGQYGLEKVCCALDVSVKAYLRYKKSQTHRPEETSRKKTVYIHHSSHQLTKQ